MMTGMSFSEVDFANDWLDNKQSKQPISVESIEVQNKKKELANNAKNRLKDNKEPYSKRSKNIPENRKKEIENLEEKQVVKQEVAKKKNSGYQNVIHLMPRRKK
jgi:hypothetical protein